MTLIATTLNPKALAAAALVAALLLLGVASPAARAASPVTWMPEESTYGSPAASFMALPAPAPAGSGMTQHGSGVAFGSGIWQPKAEVFRFGFTTKAPASAGLPPAADTDVAGTLLGAGTPVSLVFHKAPGRVVDWIAVSGELDAPLSVEPADPEALVAGDTFTIRATVGDPVATASGEAGAALGVVIDLAGDPTRFQHASLLATDMHWLDVGPPRFRAPGLAGLRARGVEGVAASVDAILSPMFLDMNAITDPATVRGYIDGSPLGTMPDAVFTPMGVGDGSLWPAGGWRYRITSGMWSAHDLGFGRLTRPVAVTALAPRGSVGTTTPTFRWRRLPSAASYQLRVYRGDRLVLAARGLTVSAWRSAKALPRAVSLTWMVRGVNVAGAGPWSPRLRLTIR